MASPHLSLLPDGALSVDDWLLLVHPALMVLFVYPVVGATIRLGILVRERRLDLNPIAATVPAEHVDHGRWVATGAVVGALVALAANLARAVASGARAAEWGGGSRLAAALALAGLALGGTLALWRVKRAALRFSCACLSGAALTILALQPPLWFQGNRPWSRLWGSHTWGGLLLIALLLVAMATAPEIRRRPLWRRLHIGSAFFSALLLAMQAISGCRDLLVLGLGAS